MRAVRVNECGHPERRHVGHGQCASCHQIAWRARTGFDSNAAVHRRMAENPDYARERSLRLKHRMSLNAFRAIAAAQEWRCAICATGPLSDSDLHVDHDHATGRIRGLLCGRCNRGIGMFDDDPDRLEAAATYARARPLERVG